MQTQTNTEINSYLSIRIGAELFAINVKNILNILEISKITKIPKSPDYIKGVINYRGSVLPVIDSRLKFNIEELGYTPNTCIVVIELHMGKELLSIGAIVDEAKEVLQINDRNILPFPGIGTSYKTEFLKGMSKWEDGFIMILDVEKVFADNEIIDIQSIAKDIDNPVTY
ncbi:MAG: purine-binding chemotaxis protein CheW [Bacteroidales bacterium]|nr:purine-binding chemotaxis protein CheW [Bacteroidales bacterium]